MTRIWLPCSARKTSSASCQVEYVDTAPHCGADWGTYICTIIRTVASVAVYVHMYSTAVFRRAEFARVAVTSGTMDGWTDGSMGGWTDGWMDGWSRGITPADIVGTGRTRRQDSHFRCRRAIRQFRGWGGGGNYLSRPSAMRRSSANRLALTSLRLRSPPSFLTPRLCSTRARSPSARRYASRQCRM